MKSPQRSLFAIVALTCGILLLTIFPSGRFQWMTGVTALLLALAAVVTDSGETRNPAREPPAIDKAAAALVIMLLLSLVPIPAGATRLFGPTRHAQVARAAAAIEQASLLGLPGEARPIAFFSFTHNRAGTLRVLLLVCAAFAAAILAARLSQGGRRAFLRILAGVGAVIGMGGYLSMRWAAQGDTLWWVFPVPPELPGPIACFCNRNHFAATLAMLAPAALSLASHDARRRNWIAMLASLACFALISCGVVLSCSRGGWVAYLVGLTALAVGLIAYRRVATAVAVLLLGCAAVALVLGTPAPKIKERVSTLQDPRATDSYATRIQCWKDSLRIWQRYPLAGAGANGFRTVYPQHRTTSESSFMTHTENEYVQTLADGGIIGVGIGVWLLVSLFRGAARSFRSPESEPVTILAAAAAVAAAMFSAVVDFALHIPLYAVVLGALAGLLLRERPAPAAARRPAAAPAFLLVAALAGAIWSAGREKTDDPRWMHTARPRDIVRALVWAPTSSYSWYYLGRAAWETGGETGMAFGERCIATAVEYDPRNYRLWKELGLIRQSIGDEAGAGEAFRNVKALRSWVPVPDVGGGAP